MVLAIDNFNKNLVRHFEHNAQEASSMLAECLRRGAKGEPGGIDLLKDGFSLRDLAVYAVSYEAVKHAAQYEDAAHFVMADLKRGRTCNVDAGEFGYESDALHTGLFAKIVGQIMLHNFNQAYRRPEYTLTALTPVTPIGPTEWDGGITPGLTEIFGEDDEVAEGRDYQTATFGSFWTNNPRTKKRGRDIYITAEMVARDQTGEVLRHMTDLVDAHALMKELRFARLYFGITNNYKKRDTAINTYQTSTPWINDHANELNSWRDIEASLTLFANRRNPDTGMPIVCGSPTLVVSEVKALNAGLIVGARELRTTTDSATEERVGQNPVANYRVVPNAYFPDLVATANSITLAQANKWWLHLDPRAFEWRQAVGRTFSQMPANSWLAWKRDIVTGYKVSERGVEHAVEPLLVNRNKHES